MRKLAKFIGTAILFTCGFWVTNYFLFSSNKAPQSTYLNNVGLTEKQRFEHTDALLLSFGYSSSYNNKFLKTLGYASTIYEIIALSQNYPETKYLINPDRQSLKEVHYIAARIAEIPRPKRPNLFVYGNVTKTNVYLEANFPSVRILKNVENIYCAPLYFAVGWSGYLPSACHNTIYLATQSKPNFKWGWPLSFLIKMKKAKTETYLVFG